jgi:formyl-CoA transferase/CoA:oxalate CoA-transferase
MQASSTTRRAPDPDPVAPLHGVRVLDLTRYLAGPYCTMLLADYGADVVRVESPGGREFRVPGTDQDTYFFYSSNRGKRSVTLDLHSPEGLELLERMLPEADVLVENFRPGVMAELGLGADRLRARFPRLIYCGISGFGADGPYRDRPGLDQVVQGMAGLMSMSGTADEGPTRSGIAIADLLAGIFAAQGIQLALLARHRTGRGQVVHTSLLEALVGTLSWGAGMYFESGLPPGQAGHHHPLSSPYGRFRARDGYINVAAAAEPMWRKLCEVLAHPEWRDDARFVTSIDRLLNRDALTREIEQALGARSVSEWVEALNRAGVPAGPVLDIAQVFADPQVRARGMLRELPHPQLGTFKTTGLHVKLSETPGAIDRAPPLLGEHTDEVLGRLGLGVAELAELRGRGVIGAQP